MVGILDIYLSGNAQYLIHLNSDTTEKSTPILRSSNSKQSLSTQSVQSRKRKDQLKASNELLIKKRFDINWNFYKGKLSEQKKLQLIR